MTNFSGNKAKKVSNENLINSIIDLYFQDLEFDEKLLKIVNICGKKFNSSRFMIGLFGSDIEEYTFQYIYESEKTKKLKSSAMTMKGSKLNSGFNEQLNRKVYFCNDTTKTKIHNDLITFYKKHHIKSTIFVGIWKKDLWCGTIGMHECFKKRIWKKNEINLLLLVSKIITIFYSINHSNDLTNIQNEKMLLLEENLQKSLIINNSIFSNKLENKNKLDKLISSAELRVLKKLVEGNTNSEIAQKLNLSIRTIETHITSMLAKLQMKNRVQLVRFALNTDYNNF